MRGPSSAHEASFHRDVQRLAYFLIEPRPGAECELAERAGKVLSGFLLAPYLMTRCFKDRSAWRLFDIAIAIKLMYLAQLREYGPLQSDEGARAILGSDRVSADLFDRWWTIRKLEFGGPTEDKQELLGLMLDKIEPTGNGVVDCWIGLHRRAVVGRTG